MRIRGLGTARRVAGWARSRVMGGPMILGYHQVHDSKWDPQRLCVSPKHFAEQLAVLTDAAKPVRVCDIATGGGQRTGDVFAVTLDDGYRDTLECALPILERFGVPATVYVSTGIIGESFWWCEIQTMAERLSTPFPKIEFEVAGYRLRFHTKLSGRRGRTEFVRAVGDYFRDLPFRHQSEALEVLADVLGVEKPSSGIGALSVADIETLASHELIDVGSHCVTHTSLNLLSADEQHVELETSKSRLESITGATVSSCSYPNGRISQETASIAAAVGYTSACGSHEERVLPKSDPMNLPRIWVRDQGERAFSRWLRWWL